VLDVFFKSIFASTTLEMAFKKRGFCFLNDLFVTIYQRGCDLGVIKGAKNSP
jgi:hypothetical protein